RPRRTRKRNWRRRPPGSSLLVRSLVVTFGQTVRCAAAAGLEPARDAGATSVICPPELAGAALELGLVPMLEVPSEVASAAYAIPAGDDLVPSVAIVDPGVDDVAELASYPLVTVVGEGAPAAIGRLRALLPATTRIGGEAAGADDALALIAAGADDLG